MEISLKQLKILLDEQKQICKQHFDKVWRESDLVKEIKKIDKEEKIINKIYEVRDPISAANYPNDFNVLRKYLE